MKRFLLLGLLIVPVAAMAGNGESTANKSDGASAPRERLICRTEAITRTRVRQNRTCLTQAEWDERRNIERESGDRLQSHQSDRGN